MHARKREGDREVMGLLIYPEVSKSIQHRYELLGYPVVVATVDLPVAWQDEGDLVAMKGLMDRMAPDSDFHAQFVE